MKTEEENMLYIKKYSGFIISIVIPVVLIINLLILVYWIIRKKWWVIIRTDSESRSALWAMYSSAALRVGSDATTRK